MNNIRSSCVVIFLQLSCSLASGATTKQILRLSASERPEACARAVLMRLKRPEGFAVKFQLHVRGDSPRGYYKSSAGAERTPTRTEFGGAERGVYAAILSSRRCYVEQARQDVRVMTTYDGARMADHWLKEGRIAQVTRNCKPPNTPIYYQQLGELLDCTPFLFGGKMPTSVETLAERIRSAEWSTVRKGSRGETVLVLRHSEDHPRFRERYAEFLFSDVEGELAVVGGDTVNSAPVVHETYGECVESYRYSWSCEYMELGGSLFPSSMREFQSRDYIALDGQPIAGPFMVRDYQMKLRDVQLLDKFPESALAIKIPRTATIEDLCAEQRLAAEEIRAEPRSTARFWVLLGAGILLAVAFVSWRYTRTR